MACYAHTEATHPYERKGVITNRDFDSNEYRGSPGFVETDWADQPWTFVACPTVNCTEHRHEQDAHQDAIVVAVDGACRGNGGPWARAAFGVFFHRNSPWNLSQELLYEFVTSQRAELYAGLEALTSVKAIREINPIGRQRLTEPPGPRRKLRRVIIKADSAYLVNGMTNWVYKWRNNGYQNCRFQPVTNADLFRRLDDLVLDLNNMGVEVQFWHVPRDGNKVADCLANAALDGCPADDALDFLFRNQYSGMASGNSRVQLVG